MDSATADHNIPATVTRRHPRQERPRPSAESTDSPDSHVHEVPAFSGLYFHGTDTIVFRKTPAAARTATTPSESVSDETWLRIARELVGTKPPTAHPPLPDAREEPGSSAEPQDGR